jgi:hypothetical protein
MSERPLTPPEAPIQPTSGGQHIPPEDLVLYAMQLLAKDQAETIEGHVPTCAACREELGRIYGDLGALSLAADVAPPSAAARERLLAQVAKEKRLIGPAKPGKAVARPAAKPAPAPAPAPRPLADFGRGRGSTLVPDPAVIQPARMPAYAWAGWAVAATLAVVSTFLYRNHRSLQDELATHTNEMQRLNAQAAQSHRLLDALTDPQAKRVMLSPKAPPKGPVGGVTYNARNGSLIFLASNLDPVQTYKTYALWIIPADGSAPIPAGTFHPDEHGSASVIMPNLRTGVDAKAFGVTIEDAGGSDKPTLPIIMSGT